ncbi:hypothetical protein PR202_ga30835 [Eleusine coracana subsp. coracana]|uniref:Uncharacterized protein n=1 Tax=Eleusine coracana subsp. coracana TaxID=191504 RepID=A0AAV5DRL0_ELECO|nr:hypothetical protein PR202_ga30835 [Eleusine coracana subsp. coracana]
MRRRAGEPHQIKKQRRCSAAAGAAGVVARAASGALPVRVGSSRPPAVCSRIYDRKKEAHGGLIRSWTVVPPLFLDRGSSQAIPAVIAAAAVESSGRKRGRTLLRCKSEIAIGRIAFWTSAT